MQRTNIAKALSRFQATVVHRRGLATVVPASTKYDHVQAPYFLEDRHTVDLTDLQRRNQIPMFTLSKARGFLPRDDPLANLPKAFETLDSLLNRMTLIQPDGSKGLLALGQFGQAAFHGLSGGELECQVRQAIESGQQDLLSALFRDMSFLASAYLLEPVDLHFKATGMYCAGRDILPACMARPFKMLADALGHQPYMEYASSYALQNWRRVDSKKGIDFDNLRLIRAFQDLGPTGSESGFILVHVDMVKNSGKLLSAAEDVLNATVARSHGGVRAGLENLLNAYRCINQSMETMWSRSLPADYLQFRSFIFGTAPGKRLNAMFPNGVFYEGVSEDPLYFRGESGANDSMIPLGDNLLELTAHMPKNALTEILRDFRKYRPETQREYIESLETRASLAGVRAFAEADPEALSLYILCVDQIREFRDRHWRFTKQYILERTTYNIATGGSPIATYLPSNLSTVLTVMEAACDALPARDVPKHLVEEVEACRQRAIVQKRVLDREVAKLIEREARERGTPMGTRLPTTSGSASDGTATSVVDEKGMARGSVGCDGVG